MKEKEFTKNDLKDLFSTFKNNENSSIDKLEKAKNSFESFNLSNQVLKDMNNNNQENSNSKYKENEIKIGNYLIKKTLGKGTFGKVKLGIYLPNNKKVAIKILEKRRIREEDDIIRLKREFEMLSQFNHPNVITVSEIFESTKAYFTVMEYCEGGELFNYIVANKFLSEEKSAFFYYQLISGLEYIHSLGIVHRDLKPENLLLTHEHILKIIDFGLSNYFKNEQKQLLETPCGSPCYASPEMLSGKSYDGFKIDIWATGIILFAMLCGYLPFDDKDNNILFQKILECKIVFPKGISNDAQDLLRKILVTNPRKRITIPEIKKHPFFLKGKKIFEKNFTIYQVVSDENEDSSYFFDFKSMDENDLANNLLYYEFEKKSNRASNKYLKDETFICQNTKERYNSDEILNIKKNSELSYEDLSKKKKLKKMINLEKKLKNLQKKKKKKKKRNNNNNEINNIELFFQEKNKFLLDKENKLIKETFLKYNHSLTFHIKDINNYVENLIIQYKIEEELNKLNIQRRKKENIEKTEKNSKMKKHTKTTKSEDNNNIRKNKFQRRIKTTNINLKTNNINKNENKKNKEKSNNKEKNKKEENKKNNIETKEFLKTQINNSLFSKKLLSPNRKNNFNTLNNKNIKINVKKKELINNLFLNKHKIIKINKLPQSIKLKKSERKMRSTRNNTSKKKNFKNILNKIKQQSVKNNINLINNKNIIHHHITNITNMTQKNYFSNVIINNYKSKEDHKVYSTSKNKSKILLDNMPIIKIDKNINVKSNINSIKKQTLKNAKLKNNLQKLIFIDDTILKNNNKLNSKTIINITDDDNKNPKKNKSNKKQIKSKEKEIENKTMPLINNNKKGKKYKIKVSFINNYNNKGYNKFLNTENSLRNFSLNKDKRDINNKNINNNDKKYKYLLTDIINVEEETINKSKGTFMASTENSYSNRENKKTIFNNFDKNKIIYNKSNKFWNRPTTKKIDNLKKNNIKFKKLINFKKFSKLNIKDILNNNGSFIKTEPNSLKYQKEINSQRNKPNGINAKRKKTVYHYLNSARYNNKKIINNSYNIGNNLYLGNLTENNPYLNNHLFKLCKFKTSLNNIRNKNTLNNENHKPLNRNFIFNSTNDNIRFNTSKNKSILNANNNELNSLIINKNNKNINKNNYLDKFIVSKKLLTSLRKRNNLKSMLLNNIFEKKINYKTTKNSTKNHKGNENKNKTNNNSVIINFPNHLKNIKIKNQINDNKKIGNKNNLKNTEYLRFKTEIYNSLPVDKKKHKKIKSMKEAGLNTKIKKNSTKTNNLLNK